MCGNAEYWRQKYNCIVADIKIERQRHIQTVALLKSSIKDYSNGLICQKCGGMLMSDNMIELAANVEESYRDISS